MSVLLAVALAVAAPPTAEQAAINSVYTSLSAARASGDASAMASHFDGDGLLIDSRPGTPLRGVELEARIAPMAARLRGDNVRATTKYRVEQRAYYGDTIVDAGYMRMQFEAPAGASKPKDMISRFMVAMRKSPDGRWRIVGDASMPATAETWDGIKPSAGLHFDG